MLCIKLYTVILTRKAQRRALPLVNIYIYMAYFQSYSEDKKISQVGLYIVANKATIITRYVIFIHVTCCFRDNGLQIPERTSYVHEIRLSLQHRAFRNLVTGSGSWLQVSAAVKGASILPYLADRSIPFFIRNQIQNPSA
jgi:hypothetical protein